MTDKPPGLRREYAEAFLGEEIARAYHHRPPYPAGVVDALLSLLGPGGGPILDIGCGTGELARALVDEAERVDAVDVSRPMIEEGRRLERGDHPRLRWICARAEEAPLDLPYALVVAGDSLNWMDWPVVLPRLREALRPAGWLAIVHRNWGTGTPEETDIIRRHSIVRDYRPYNLGQELESRGLFRGQDQVLFTGPWQPAVEEYVESRHTQASFPRSAMGDDQAAEFDRELTELLQRLVAEGRLRTRGARLDLQVLVEVGWGRPLTGPAS